MELLDSGLGGSGGGGRKGSTNTTATVPVITTAVVNSSSRTNANVNGASGAAKVELSKQSYILAEQLARKTHFSINEILSLLVMYQRMTVTASVPQGKMDRLRFREVVHKTFDITDDIMLDRAHKVFDTNNDGIVDEPEWILGLSILVKGSLDEQIHFCYAVYDINGDRALAREELYHCLRNCLIRLPGIEEDIEESIKDIVEIALKKLDLDKNGTITFPDYQAAVRGDKLLLLACGNCLPSSTAKAHFLSTFQQDYFVPQKTVNHIVAHGPK